MLVSSLIVKLDSSPSDVNHLGCIWYRNGDGVLQVRILPVPQIIKTQQYGKGRKQTDHL